MVNNRNHVPQQCLPTGLDQPAAAAACNCDPGILEKCVHALTLLGYLVESGLPFIFKGGTSLLLHMPQVQRLSRDIDIVCGSPAAEVNAVVQTIGTRAPFLRWQEDDRGGRRSGGLRGGTCEAYLELKTVQRADSPPAHQ